MEPSPHFILVAKCFLPRVQEFVLLPLLLASVLVKKQRRFGHQAEAFMSRINRSTLMLVTMVDVRVVWVRMTNRRVMVRVAVRFARRVAGAVFMLVPANGRMAHVGRLWFEQEGQSR